MCLNAQKFREANQPSHYLPTFYGDYLGLLGTREGLALVYQSDKIQHSLITLQFAADSLQFIELRCVLSTYRKSI